MNGLSPGPPCSDLVANPVSIFLCKAVRLSRVRGRGSPTSRVSQSYSPFPYDNCHCFVRSTWYVLTFDAVLQCQALTDYSS